MSFVVVTMVYVLVFLGGEGLTSDQIKADPTKNFDVVERFWLRVRLERVEVAEEKLLTGIQDTIRTRHMLGHVHRNRPDRFRKVLCPSVREKAHRSNRLLGLNRAHRNLVHMVVGRLDQHVPSAGNM